MKIIAGDKRSSQSQTPGYIPQAPHGCSQLLQDIHERGTFFSQKWYIH